MARALRALGEIKMKLRAFVLSVLCAAAFGVGPAWADWSTFTSKTSQFSAQFPAAPRSEVTNEKVNVGGKELPLTQNLFTAKDSKGSICIVVHSIYAWPIDIEGELVADRDNFSKQVSATVTQSRRMTLARGARTGLPALHFDATAPTYRFRSVVVIDGQAVYQIAGGVPVAGGDDADLDRCVNSFTLIDTK
jgi:hypothetical protein